MRGMLLKQFLYLKRHGKTLPLIIIMIALIALPLSASSSVSTACSIIAMVAAMLTIFVMFNNRGIDEQAKWDTYARSLPVSPYVTVGSQYIITAIFALAGMAAQFIVFTVSGTGINKLAAVVIVFTGAIPLAICDIALPFCYWLGCRKASYIFLLFCLTPVVASFLQAHGINPTLNVSNQQTPLLLGLSVLIVFAVTLVSLFISCKIYTGKEV